MSARSENIVTFCTALAQRFVVTLFFPLVVHNNQFLENLYATISMGWRADIHAHKYIPKL